jgi:hypothetical protein
VMNGNLDEFLKAYLMMMGQKSDEWWMVNGELWIILKINSIYHLQFRIYNYICHEDSVKEVTPHRISRSLQVGFCIL